MNKEILLKKVRLHYIYCVYGDSGNPVEEVRDFFSLDIGEDVNVYNVIEPAFCLNKDGEEYVKFFDDDSNNYVINSFYFDKTGKRIDKDGVHLGTTDKVVVYDTAA